MKSNATSDGLSARRKTISIMRPSMRFKLLTVKLSIASILLVSCQEKIKGQEDSAAVPQAAIGKDSLVKPHVNVKVNRRFDEKGNLVGLDSLYSTYYSTHDRDKRVDSLMNNFDTYFHRAHPLFFNNRFNNLFFNDSLRYPDFFHQDFFMKHYEMNDAYMKDMMKQMDSIKNQFFKDRNMKDEKHDTI